MKPQKEDRRGAGPLFGWYWLEGEAGTEFALERAGRVGAGRVDEASDCGREDSVGGTIVEIVSVVGAVGEVEGLRDYLQVHVLAEPEVLREFGIQLEVVVTADAVVGNQVALSSKVAGFAGGAGEECLRTCVGHDHSAVVETGAEAEGVTGGGDGVGTSRSELQDGRELHAVRQVDDTAGGDVMTLIVSGRPELILVEGEARIAGVVAEGSAATVVGHSASQGVVAVEGEVIAHAAAIAEVESVIAGATDGFFVANARKNRLSSCHEGGGKRAHTVDDGVDVDGLVFVEGEHVHVLGFEDRVGTDSTAIATTEL